jgi:hypothetical protein
MKHFVAIGAVSLGICAALYGPLPAIAATTVGVSVGINQPGIYGRVDIGNYPQPVLVYPEPVIITPAPRVYPRQPIYLYVPPGHQTHWAQHCWRYNACGQPVFFVHENWVRERYAYEHPGWHDYRHGYRNEGRREERREERFEGRREGRHEGRH